MPYHLKTETENKTIHFYGEGLCTIRELREARIALIARGEEAGFTRFLVDLRSMNLELSSLELYDFCYSHKDYFFGDHRLAVLYNEQVVKREEVIFIEDLTHDGGTGFSMFTQPAEARLWLAVDASDAGAFT